VSASRSIFVVIELLCLIQLPLKIERKDGRSETIEVILRIDTPIEVDYYRHGGILPYVLRGLLGAA
jgi:aconitate hydratase